MFFLLLWKIWVIIFKWAFEGMRKGMLSALAIENILKALKQGEQLDN